MWVLDDTDVAIEIDDNDDGETFAVAGEGALDVVALEDADKTNLVPDDAVMEIKLEGDSLLPLTLVAGTEAAPDTAAVTTVIFPFPFSSSFIIIMMLAKEKNKNNARFIIIIIICRISSHPHSG